MDEPFSALDVLTAENLRTELMDLWAGDRFPTRGICIVTHNIEEAVLLADRVVVLGANPGHIRAEVTVALQRPRDRRSPVFASLVDQLYGLLTGRETEHAAPGPTSPTTQPLPPASVGGLAGLVEIVDADGGRVDLPDVAAALNFEIDDLLPLVDAAAMLGFLDVAGGDLTLTLSVRSSPPPTSNAASRSSPRRPATAPHWCAPSAPPSPAAATATSAPGSSWTCCRRLFAPATPGDSSTRRSTGLATQSCSTTTPTATRSPPTPPQASFLGLSVRCPPDPDRGRRPDHSPTAAAAARIASIVTSGCDAIDT